MQTDTNNCQTQKPILTNTLLYLILDYEVRSCRWVSWIGWKWGQELAAKYFAWKTKRKYARYKQSKMLEQRIKDFRDPSSNIKF